MLDTRNRNAVSITHIPTGISDYVDSHRHLYKNKAEALKLLKARLWAAKNIVHLDGIDAVFLKYEFPEDITLAEDLNDYKETVHTKRETAQQYMDRTRDDFVRNWNLAKEMGIDERGALAGPTK